LIEGCLYYFKDEKASSADAGPEGVVQLVEVDIQPLDTDKIQLTATNGSLQYVKFERKKPPQMVRGVSVLLLRASSLKTRDKWLYRIRKSYVHANFTGEVATGPPTDLRSVSEVTSPSLTDTPDSDHPGKLLRRDLCISIRAVRE
jgi:hypothetical protein